MNVRDFDKEREAMQKLIEEAEAKVHDARMELYFVEGYAKEMREEGKYSDAFMAHLSNDVGKVRTQLNLRERELAILQERMRKIDADQQYVDRFPVPIHGGFDYSDDGDEDDVIVYSSPPIEPPTFADDDTPARQCQECGLVIQPNVTHVCTKW